MAAMSAPAWNHISMAQSVRIPSKRRGFKVDFKPLATLPVTSEWKRLLAPKLHINYNSLPDQQPLMREGEITNAGQGVALATVIPALLHIPWKQLFSSLSSSCPGQRENENLLATWEQELQCSKWQPGVSLESSNLQEEKDGKQPGISPSKEVNIWLGEPS